MLVKFREKKFVEKATNKEVVYNEFYVTFDVCIEEEYESFDLVLKIDDKFAKEMLTQNIASSDFDIKKAVKNGVTYWNPVITFVVGQNAYNIPVKLSTEAVILARIALAE